MAIAARDFFFSVATNIGIDDEDEREERRGEGGREERGGGEVRLRRRGAGMRSSSEI